MVSSLTAQSASISIFIQKNNNLPYLWAPVSAGRLMLMKCA